ncbi:MAG: InlB B-repeat-containing protein [Bacteroidaceae bacterium]|nr:InlB B-repeat-containing protein [Bacteroidaceae bacterium]
MMKNSNLMTRVALTLLVMMLTATTAWATTMTVKYSFGSFKRISNSVRIVNVSATGYVNKNYSVTITEQNNGREASFAFSPAADITLAWRSTEAFFSFHSNSSGSFFGGGDSSKYWTLTIGSANYYITNVKFYNYEDELLYETDNNSKSCDLYLRNNDMYISSTSLDDKTTHAIEVTLSDTPSYNISYELNGGTNASSNPSTYTYNIGVASFANPTRTGYTFGGWYVDSSFSTVITSISTTAFGKVTLYAKWTANTYTVVYDANGGSGSMSDQTFTYDQTQNLSANTFTYTGKLFDRWNTAANGSGTSYSDGQSVPNVTATNGARVTLYAQWKTAPGYPTGSGTASDPYLISSIDQWNTFANANNYKMFYDSDKHIELGADISGVTTTVGTQEHPFKGTFNGNNKTLTVNINETSTQGTAPFREINGATIKNLTVTGSVTGTTHAAALVGFSRSGTNTIEDCNVSANVTVNTGNNKHCGGLVGHAVNSTLTIQNCIYSGTINNGGNYAGGLQGWSDGSTLTIENSLFSGSYTGSGLFHPIAVRYENASMTCNINGAYYTAVPTLTDAAFIVTPGTQAYTSQQSFPCKSATILGTTIYYIIVDFTPFGKTDSYSPDGSAERPFIISNTDGWDYFCNALQDNDTWNRFSGMTVKLGENITVTRMAGSGGHEFCGTFDGDDHTLTVQYGSPAAPIEQQQFVAPFVETARNTSPVFRNLTIDGNIYVKYADSSVEPGVGGLIGHLFGNVKVEHCVSNVVINSNKDRVGGFVGLCEYDVSFTDCKSSAVVSSSIGNISGFVGWSRSSAWTIAFEGCLFNGKLLQLNGAGGSGGCFVGWKGDAKTVNINNCLVAPATGAEGESMASSGSATFCRQHNDKLPAVIKNSYYTTAFGADQGTQVHSIKAGKGVSVAMASNVIKKYETSGITFYDTGIMCNGKFYAVKDDEVSLTLSHEDQEGYAFLGYEAKDSLQNAFTLTPAGDNYTLTMPDDDVTVTSKVVKVYSLTLPDRMEVVSADQTAIGGKYQEGTTIQFKVNSDYVVDGDVKNGDDVLDADDKGFYTVTVGNADITILATVKKAVEPNVILSGGDYTAQDGDVLTGSTDGTVTIEDCASITLSDVTINGGIICQGTATITLVGENSVTGLNYKAGIQVGDSGTTLTIKGNGSLTATGDWGSAGIGTGAVYEGSETFGNIVIEGGSISVYGGNRSAGIGTGYVYKGSVTLGDITIEGGSITAKGGDDGAGIGTGAVDGGGRVTLGNITIEGGSITANGGYYYGAGIGTGEVFNGTVTLVNITIKGGSITANGGDYGAGIGTGYVYNSTVNLGTLTIYDDIDRVDATGNRKSGISENIVYMHGETNVTESASDYFIITHDDNHDVIKTRKHAITLVNDGQHGTVTVAAKAMSDESVTITVTPDNGYMLDTIEVKDANGNEVELDENDMSFTMPDSNVTIWVTWKLAGVKGDVNGDGKVDISDVVALVNAILNDESNDAYDVSGDNAVDINDVVALVNLILNN